MKKKKEKEKYKKQAKVYETLAITEADRKLKDSNTSIPSEQNVEDAKDWVDYNGLS